MGMTDRDRKLLAVFAVVVVLGGYWFLILGKKRTAVAEAEQAKSAAQQQLDAAKLAQDQGKKEKKRYPVSYSRVVKLGKAVPADADYASLVVQVSDIAAQAGVSFDSLISTEGAATGGAGATGVSGLVTTCGESGASGATGGSAPGTSGAVGATGATGSTSANTAIGQAVNDAHSAAGDAAAGASGRAGAEQEDAQRCAAAPTLTDLAAVQSGLKLKTYSFKFRGSFFRLHAVMHRLLDMVKVRNGRVRVTGRLLQINKIKFDSESFPDIKADIDMTGYVLPSDATLTAGASPSGPAGSPAPAAAPGPAPSPGAQ